MAGEVAVTLSEEDYLAANRDWYRFYLVKRERLYRSGGVVLLCGALGGFLAYSDGTDMLAGAASLAAIGAGALLFCYGLGYILLPRRARRIFRQQARYSYTYCWSDAGLGYTSERATANLPWSDFFRWAESRRCFLFFLNEQIFYVLPKRVLSEAQASDLRATATAFGPTRR